MNIKKHNLNWRGPLTPLKEVQKLIQHHTAHPTWGVAETHGYHRDHNGWLGIGYNYMIYRDGSIHECRGLNVGAHSGASWNGRSLGICYQGHLSNQEMTDEQVESGAWLNAKFVRENDLTVADIIGHGDVSATECPGNNFRMDEIHNAAEGLLNKDGAKPDTDNGELYRVQVGAFAVKSYADRLESDLRTSGYDTYMVEDGGLYKVQTGAFAVKENAEAMAARLEKEGYDTYITTRGGEPASAAPKPKPKIKQGSRVKVNRGARDYNGGSLASFVYTRVYDVIQLSGARAVIGQNGAVTAAVNIKDLYLA